MTGCDKTGPLTGMVVVYIALRLSLGTVGCVRACATMCVRTGLTFATAPVVAIVF